MKFILLETQKQKCFLGILYEERMEKMFMWRLYLSVT
jgi:hypothetical protein